VSRWPLRWKPPEWNAEHSDLLDMDTLRAMKALVRTVELGSLSAAARSLGTTQPTVSKLLADLERQAGAKLLERSSTRIQPTTEGERFLETARRVVEDYEEALVELQGLRAEPRGLVRLAAPVALGQCWLNPRLPAFLERHPGIELEVMLEDRFVDVVEERIDVALRIGGELPPHLVARPFAQWPRYLVASPAYLQSHGRPRHPTDLAAHDYLRYASGAADEVTLSGAEGTLTVPTHSRYRINSAVALLHSVEQGLGITLQPSWMVEHRIQQGQLERVLPDWVGPAQVAHVLYPPRRRQPARVAALLDFLFSALRGGG
jgi:DNA-binding transcriptional LysR family regulator